MGSLLSSPVIATHTLNNEKYREPDLQFSTYKIDDTYYGSFSGTINVDENIFIDATIDTSGYLEIGTGYGEVIFDRIYSEAYINYGRSDTTDIYTLGVFAGMPVSEEVMLFFNSSYDWRKTQNNIGGTDNLGLFDEEEWKNTIGFSYQVHKWVSFSATYNIDYLVDTPIVLDDKTATSWDSTFTINSPLLKPYIKYSKGNYRVSPEQQRKSQDSIEFGVNFNF